MLLTPHILSGMLFGSFSSTPFLSPILGFISYFILEMIPHWDPENTDRKLVKLIRIIDIWTGVISFILVVAFLRTDPTRYIVGGISAALMYLAFTVLHLFPHQNEFLKKLKKYKIGLKYTDRSSWGILIQISICILAVAIMFNMIDFPTWSKIKEQFLI